MATPQRTASSAWAERIASDLAASDQVARQLVTGLTEEQLNWQPAPGSWSIGQCLEHLCNTNEAYHPAIAAALEGKPDSPVREIVPGWFGAWFLHSFVEPSPKTKRVSAPKKIRPGSRVDVSVLKRFLSGNQVCREVVVRAQGKNVNRIRFWNPFIPGLRFTTGTGFAIIAAHERRHLQQAERVRNSARFPR
jgi:hypothetical protein